MSFSRKVKKNIQLEVQFELESNSMFTYLTPHFSQLVKITVIVYGSGGGGVAPKRKGLGKQNFEWVKGWVNEKQNNSRVG
jgi:hypothetical protein